MTERRDTEREFSAVPIAIVVVLIAAAVFGGIWLGTWAAVLVTVVLALAVIGFLVYLFTRRGGPSAADAPHVSPVADDRHRILVIADEGCGSPSFADDLRSHASGNQVSVFVMAPALESRIGRLTGDQHGYDDAARHLQATLATLNDAEIAAQGEIGASDPLQAADDGLRQFPADEIVFVTRAGAPSNWLEKGVIAAAESRYEQPVRHTTVEAA
jgi:hypothetical protein